MGLISKERVTAGNETPLWLKRTLLVLLFGSAAAGFIFTVFTIHHSLNGHSKVIDRQVPALEIKRDDMPAIFQKSALVQSTEIILCQGVVSSANGQAKAIINGETVETGAVVSGATILEITAGDVLIECNGITSRIAPGESYNPRRK